ncbi:MFS transporter [Oceanobacillus arenosus]|uniref:MFS transporter n=1 Tax=Oceanobacillus arenosus TaxID=1229153 RepID=A0A3D8PLD1_9BACI|nr:MFS transporter [Oceanobacillus arenosus]RDW16041.1 MFS transporter [Oceanobacillus arenosus]
MDNNIDLTKQNEKSYTIPSERLPWAGLIALAMAGFICILTETIPAGLLIQISEGLGVSESLAGQLVTAYALGSLIAAIPITTATQGWQRKPLLLLCIIGFLVFNTITALSSSLTLTLIARFFAGVTAGVLWGMTAGYARLMAPDSLRGRAMAVAMVGTPLALAFGVPVGTFLGYLVGWRSVFGIMSLLAALLIIWIIWKLPDFPGQTSEKRITLLKVFVTPGVRPILFVVLAWILSHNILYTYIGPYLSEAGLAQRVDLVLLVFGTASLVGIWVIGVLIERILLRTLVLISLFGFGLASLALGIGISHPTIIYIAVGLWGLTFGGAATLTQTTIADTAGKGAELAQSMLVTVWNLAIGGGSAIGAILMESFDVGSFPWVMFILILLGFLVVFRASVYGFPSKDPMTKS